MDNLVKETNTNDRQEKRDKLTRNLYSLPAFGSAASMAFFSSYLGMLFTDIYMIPVVLSGVLEMMRSLIGWLFGPTFGIFLDRVTLKIGKYWPWVLAGTIGTNVLTVITFVLPSMTDTPQKFAFLVFVLGILIALFTPLLSISLVSFYPRLSSDPKVRSYLAIGQKVGRDGGKTIWGLIVPVLLVHYTKAGGSDAAGWASTAYVIGAFTIILNAGYAFILKGSSIEKEAIAAKYDANTKKKPQIPLSAMLKGIVTNKALLSMFLFLSIHKIYYFFQILTASYFFKYVTQDFSSMGTFMLSFNLCAVVGAVFGVVWVKIFKDSKKAFVAGGVVHIIILGYMTLFYKGMSTGVFIIVAGAASFFAGVIEAYLMPMFAAASDWGMWKTGVRSDGISMAVFSLCITVATFFSTLIRTALLAAAGYDGAAYAQGAMPNEAVLNVIGNFQTLYPFILGIVAFGIVLFFYPMDDKKLAKIKEEIDAGRVGELANKDAINIA
ncbi:putative symporter YjmB [Oxobacter pfennigii]|uniref:Putative symporter YjmB n=1 Tax=Oxobacter pfennigii TaxID=36849 RepID=A0A0P8YX25_9CLOT|nr:MFS transporter [Oxobacter pfennigii]KPU44279.1 putative symporter YjmB [Oxobacter pfennigii]